MDNLDLILEEILVSTYERIVDNELKILKSLNNISLKEIHTLDIIAKTTKSKTNTSTNISKILDITPGTLTTNLERLIERGYVYKEKSEDDKRVVWICLTQLGQGLRKKREKLHKNIVSNAVSKLSQSEKVALTSVFNKIDI